MGGRNRPRVVLLCALLFAAAARAQQPADEPAAPAKNALVEELRVSQRFENDGQGETVQTERLRILTEVGLKIYGAVYVAYSSELEDLRIDYLRTIKADGTVIHADSSKAMDVTPPVTRSAPMFSDVKVKVLVAPQVQVGDAIEYQYTRTIRKPYMPGNFWVLYSLDRANPITSAAVALDVPSGRKLTFISDPCFHYTIENKNGRKVYRWHIENLNPPKDSQADQPPLFAASTLSDWKQVADWFAALQAEGTRVTPEIQSLADKLAAGKTTPEQKLDAIYAYVSEEIRYVAIEFGIGGYQAHSAPLVLANGYGDCKDKAELLETLLAAEGIKAYPALVNATRTRIEPAAPMPSQFDHEMTVVPMDGKNIWLDSTLQTAPPGILSPSVLGKQALLVEPGAGQLVAVPDAPPFPQRNSAIISGGVDAAGKLTLKYSAQVDGIVSVFMRQVFRLQDKDQLSKFVKGMAQFQLGGASASDPSSSDPDDLSGPFKFQYTLSKVGFLDLLQKDEQVRLPILFIGPDQWQTQIAKADEETKEDSKAQASPGCAANPPENISLYGPLESHEELDLAVPARYQVELPEPIRVERPFGSYSSSYSFDNNHIQVRRDLKLNKGTIPLAQLEALRNFQDLINNDLKQEPTFRRAGSGDVLSDSGSMTAEELNTAGQEALDKHHKPVVARDLLLKAVGKDPKSQYAWNNLGRAYASIGNYDQAERAYKKQISINPYDQFAYNNLGYDEMSQQRYDRAIADFKQQLQVNPLDRFANANLPSAFAQERDWTDAAAAYAAAVRVSPGDALLEVAWGGALFREGKTDDGRRAMEQALEISKQPVVLNNAAYAMAQAGVDLAKAEGYARSAVDQTIPENVASLEVPENYNVVLNSLSAYLDTLGWTLYKENKLAEAGSCLRAAFEIRNAPDIARHLAMLAMAQNDPGEAQRYYSYAAGLFDWKPPHFSRSLLDYLRSHGGLPEMTAGRVAEIQKQMLDLKRLPSPPGHPFTLPPSAGAEPAWVALNVLVDEQGHVTDAKVMRGSEPYNSAAQTDARQLRFPPLAWSNHRLATVRTAYFLYDPQGPEQVEKVLVLGHPGAIAEPADHSFKNDYLLMGTNAVASFFIVEGDIPAGLKLLAGEEKDSQNIPDVYRFMVLTARELKREGELQAAAAVLREALPLQPKDDFAFRELAETLKAAGDHAGAIQAFQQLLNLDADDAAAHFSLGAEYEAEAGKSPAAEGLPDASGKKKRNKSRKSPKGEVSQTEFQSALAQYSQAVNLDPENALYHHAYETLYEKINHAPPPAAAGNPAPSPNP